MAGYVQSAAVPKDAALCAFIRKTSMKLFSPAAYVLTKIGNAVARHTKGDPEVTVTEDELYDIIDNMKDGGDIDAERGELVHSALAFADVAVETIVTPRVDLLAINVDTPVKKIVEMMRTSKHSRFPVYEESIDNIIGVLQIRKFMFRYITVPRDDPTASRKGETRELFLSGLFFGIGAASKWTAIYAGVGLFLLWLWYRIERYRDLKAIGHLAEHRRELWTNIGQCVVFFLLIPGVIYYMSYYYYGVAKGWSGIQMYFTKDYAKLVVDTQVRMGVNVAKA